MSFYIAAISAKRYANTELTARLVPEQAAFLLLTVVLRYDSQVRFLEVLME
jgi:hypothetical protein